MRSMWEVVGLVHARQEGGRVVAELVDHLAHPSQLQDLDVVGVLHCLHPPDLFLGDL
jgi:hypothetical protein